MFWERWERWWARVTGRADADLDRELRTHLELEEAEQIDAGLTPQRARDAARRAFGNATLVKEDARASWGWTAVERRARDVRFGLRGLWRTKWISAAAVTTLAVGIGANAALFSVIDAVLLRALPFREPQQLVMVTEANAAGIVARNFAPTTFFDWTRHNESFSDLAAIHTVRDNLVARGEPIQAVGQDVSANIFDLLGVQPALGRTLVRDDGLPGRPRVVLLSNSLWLEQFGADPTVVGQTVSLDARPATIVGVMPQTFELPGEGASSFWKPITLDPQARWNEGRYLRILGRLRPGVSPTRAALELRAICDRFEQDAPVPGVTVHVPLSLPTLLDYSGRDLRQILIVLWAAVACVLVVACTNVAALLLARSMTRRREIAVRLALGATRGRLIAQLLTESVTLAVIGGGLGLLVAWLGVHALMALVPVGIAIPRVEEIGPNPTVLIFTLGLIVATGVLFGIVPAWQASNPALTTPLRQGEGARGTVGGGRLRGSLVIAEVALAMVLLVCAGLLVRSLAYLRAVNPGFDDRNVLTASVAPAGPAYRTNAQQAAYFGRALERVREVPGVRHAAFITYLPVSGAGSGSAVHLEGQSDRTAGQASATLVRAISPQYFATLGIPLLQGRDLTDQDTVDRPRVMVVNQALVDRVFGNENPLGRRLVVFWGSDVVGEVVGVVGNVRYSSLAHEEGPTLYWPIAQLPEGRMVLVARTEDDPKLFAGAIAGAIRSVDRNVPLARIKPLAELRADASARTRFSVTLLGAFAGIAMLLALVGLFGVLAHGVAQRTPEIGVRLAMGAEPVTVFGMVLKEGMRLVAVGVVVGAAIAVAATRFIASQLSGVEPTDALTFVGVALLLCGAALAAVSLPALRAAKVDPLMALQHE